MEKESFIILALIILVFNSLPAGSLLLNGRYVCPINETFVDVVKVKEPYVYYKRSTKWCASFPFRCSTYERVWSERMVERNVEKTREVAKCCKGYVAGSTDDHCQPFCSQSCRHGICLAPDYCQCEAGFIGKLCEENCPRKTWGLKCSNSCECENGAFCDPVKGKCHCPSGWLGVRCDTPCPDGFYGVGCSEECNCGQFLCHHITGECIFTTTVEPSTTVETTSSPNTTTFYSLEIESTTTEATTTPLYTETDTTTATPLYTETDTTTATPLFTETDTTTTTPLYTETDTTTTAPLYTEVDATATTPLYTETDTTTATPLYTETYTTATTPLFTETDTTRATLLYTETYTTTTTPLYTETDATTATPLYTETYTTTATPLYTETDTTTATPLYTETDITTTTPLYTEMDAATASDSSMGNSYSSTSSASEDAPNITPSVHVIEISNTSIVSNAETTGRHELRGFLATVLLSVIGAVFVLAAAAGIAFTTHRKLKKSNLTAPITIHRYYGEENVPVPTVKTLFNNPTYGCGDIEITGEMPIMRTFTPTEERDPFDAELREILEAHYDHPPSLSRHLSLSVEHLYDEIANYEGRRDISLRTFC